MKNSEAAIAAPFTMLPNYITACIHITYNVMYVYIDMYSNSVLTHVYMSIRVCEYYVGVSTSFMDAMVARI